MTFPSASETGGTNSASTSHDLTLPTFSTGDLIIVKAETPSNPTHTWTFDSSTSKFTQLWQQDTSVSVSREVCKYRIMQAGDGSTLTIGLGSSRALTYSIILVTGWHGTQAPECATAATGYGDTLNPPSVTASWGSADNLFIACAMTQDRAITVATPADYTAFTNRGSDTNGYERQAYRQLASATSDPGNFQATGNSRYITNTIVVRPYSLVSTEANAGCATATGTAYDDATWASQPAGVAEATGTVPATAATFGAFAAAGLAEATGTAYDDATWASVFTLVAEGTGTAADATASASMNANAGCATGTGTAYDRLTAATATPSTAFGWGWCGLASPWSAAAPLVLPTPLTVTLGPTDVTDLVVSGISWDSTLGAVPTAQVTLSDLDAIVPWPLDPVTELRIAAGDTGLFYGSVTSWQREWIAAGVFVYTLRAEGWQRLAGLSPVYPFTTETVTQEAPDGVVVTADTGKYLGLGTDDNQPPTDIDVIYKALAEWLGPPLSYDVPYRTTVSWTIRPRGAPLSSVLDDIAARLGYDDVWWIDADLVFHWRPGLRGGSTDYRGEAAYLARFRLDDRPDPGVVVPARVTDSADGSQIREGVYANGTWPGDNALVTGGPLYAGREVMSVATRQPYIPYLLGSAWLYDRQDWRRTISVTLPPQPAGAEIPTVGSVVSLAYEDVEPTARYYMIRSVRAAAVVTGEGIGDIEWTLELGDSERRSYVYEEAELVEAATKPVEPQVVQLEVAPVSDMGKDSTQYVIARPVDGAHNRVQLDGGSVHWSIWLNDADIGAGDPDVGWWLTAEDTDVVFEDKDEARRWGYAYCELHCGTNAQTIADDEPDAVVVVGELHG